MGFNFGQFALNLLIGAASGATTALTTGHTNAAGPLALLGGALTGVGFLQDPHKVSQADLLAAAAGAARAEAQNVIRHNSGRLSVLAPMVASNVDSALQSAFTTPGTNAPVATPGVPFSPPAPAPPLRAAAPTLKPVAVTVDTSALQRQIVDLQRQLAASQQQNDTNGDPNAPPAGPGIPSL